MGTVRVYDLATQFRLTTKEVLDRLHAAGVDALTFSSAVEEEAAKEILSRPVARIPVHTIRPGTGAPPKPPSRRPARTKAAAPAMAEGATEAPAAPKRKAKPAGEPKEEPKPRTRKKAVAPAIAKPLVVTLESATVEHTVAPVEEEPAVPVEAAPVAVPPAPPVEEPAPLAPAAEAPTPVLEPPKSGEPPKPTLPGKSEPPVEVRVPDVRPEPRPEPPPPRPRPAAVEPPPRPEPPRIEPHRVEPRRPGERSGPRPPHRAPERPRPRPSVEAPRPAPSAAHGRDLSGMQRAARDVGATIERPVEAPPTPPPAPPAPKILKVGEGMTPKELAERMSATTSDVIKRLIKLGMLVTINTPIDPETIGKVAQQFGYTVERASEEEMLEEALAAEAVAPELLIPRAPVVTVMGHVDHGKTSLLDAIRHTNVIATEAGGITQHIGAYEVEVPGHTVNRVVFLDTPGHEAFTAMRARGAQATDIVVLVVAADDGVMPQTIEAIHHAKDAKVPILVAINKIDKPGADPNRIKQQLTEYGLVAEEWGGETIFVAVSAKRRDGIENLLENLIVLAEVQELKGNPAKPGRGVVVEAELDKGRGPVATILVQTGTLRVGDVIVAGLHHGRVRAMLNDKGRKIAEAGPATPVEILGLSGVPLAGDSFAVAGDERKARQIATARQERHRQEAMVSSQPRVTLDQLHQQIEQGAVKELRLILKGDVQGSVEPLRESLERLGTERVKVNVIHSSVGAITESDIMLASASNAIIVGFNVRPDPKAQKLAEQERVDLRLYDVIYEAINQVRSAMEGLLEPTFEEHPLARVEVRQIFNVSKVGTIAGSFVVEGKVPRDAAVRLVRDGRVVHTGKIGSLKRYKDDVREVVSGQECGIGLLNYNDVHQGDILEVFELTQVAPTL